jgi:signal transduction histidine kinase
MQAEALIDLGSDALQVLIVEDDIGDQRMFQRTIRRGTLNCTVTVAETLSSAMTLGGSRFDAILLDNSLPDGEGVSAIDALRRSFPAAGIVLATGQGCEELAANAIKLGADDYIAKSRVTDASLQRILHSVVSLARLKALAEDRRKELEIFAYMVTHDLKAPAQNIATLARAVIEDLDYVSKEVTLESLYDMETCATRQLELLAAVSAHIGMGAVPQMVRANLGEIVAAACSFAGIGKVGAPVEIEPLPEVVCSAPELRQLFQNLILNSLKFCVDRRPRIRVSWRPDGEDHVQIRVADNGIGVPADKREEIFKPFHRLHSRSEFEGTGLGLATCTKIVKRHGGRIWCEATEGGGLTVCLTLAKDGPR